MHARDTEETHIEITAGDMKKREPFPSTLPPKLTTMLRIYGYTVLKGSSGKESTFLFDNGAGEPKLETTISWLIERTIQRHLGLKMTAHQFRHLAAKVVLDADPGAYETVRQLLGHRNLTTTVNHYAGLNTRRAGRHHAALIERELTRVSASAKPKRRQSRQTHGRA